MKIKGILLYHQLAALWNKAAMYARKWLSNSPEIHSAIPVEVGASEIDLDSGVLPDIFSFHSNPPEENQIITKRSFIRIIATLFDPLHFFGPIHYKSKSSNAGNLAKRF